MQSLREVPGFLAFTSVFVLLILREQVFCVVALAVFGIGIALTGFFPSVYGLYFTVVLMSLGFHYMETCRQSLSLQWLPKSDAPRLLGRLMSIGAITSFFTYGTLTLVLMFFELNFQLTYLVAGVVVLLLVFFLCTAFPQFQTNTQQHKRIVLRSRYWLYYALTFLSGARRQIFVAFAGFLLVQKFDYSVLNITILLLINHVVNGLVAETIGYWIGKVGERTALTVEYLGLTIIFTSYAFVDSALLAGGLYVVDHFFFTMAIAIKTYFQKIADPKDIAATAGVSFTVNHISAVVIPAILGTLWMRSHSIVFLIGSGFAACSLILAQLIPRHPTPDHEADFPLMRKAIGTH